MNDYHKYKPEPTSKQEIIKALEAAAMLAIDVSYECAIHQVPTLKVGRLNQQLGALRTLAEHLPENSDAL